MVMDTNTEKKSNLT